MRAKILAFELLARDLAAQCGCHTPPVSAHKKSGAGSRTIFSRTGRRPTCELKPSDMLLAVQKIEARGWVESAHRVKRVGGQIFCYVVVGGESSVILPSIFVAHSRLPRRKFLHHRTEVCRSAVACGLWRNGFRSSGGQHQYALERKRLGADVISPPSAVRQPPSIRSDAC